MFSDQHTHAVSTGIASPGAYENQAIRGKYPPPGRMRRLINIGKHHCHIEYSEKSCNDLVCMKLRIAKYKYTHAHDQQCHHKHHTIRYKIKYQIQIIYNGSHISDDTRCTCSQYRIHGTVQTVRSVRLCPVLSAADSRRE